MSDQTCMVIYPRGRLLTRFRRTRASHHSSSPDAVADNIQNVQKAIWCLTVRTATAVIQVPSGEASGIIVDEVKVVGASMRQFDKGSLCDSSRLPEPTAASGPKLHWPRGSTARL
jgi:hypothetical protein